MSPQTRAQLLAATIIPGFKFGSDSVTIRSKSGNVYVISLPYKTQIWQKGLLKYHACLQLTIPAPVWDRVIAEYLLIKNNENYYLNTAVLVTDKDYRKNKLIAYVLVTGILFGFGCLSTLLLHWIYVTLH